MKRVSSSHDSRRQNPMLNLHERKEKNGSKKHIHTKNGCNFSKTHHFFFLVFFSPPQRKDTFYYYECSENFNYENNKFRAKRRAPNQLCSCVRGSLQRESSAPSSSVLFFTALFSLMSLRKHKSYENPTPDDALPERLPSRLREGFTIRISGQQ